MIEWGMVEWLVGFLQDHASIPPYTLEYGCALLMNLCLRTAGRQKCTPHVNSVLKLLTDLLGSSNSQVRCGIPWVIAEYARESGDVVRVVGMGRCPYDGKTKSVR